MRKERGVGAAAAMVLAAGSIAAAGVQPVVLQVLDHPDAFHAPPGYGLRLDNIFAGIGGPTGFVTFSFNHFNNTTLTFDGSELRIAGTVYGGLDTGSTWGFGEGAYALEFTYRLNLLTAGTGWIAGESPLNNGTLTALGDNSGVPSGTVFDLVDKNDHAGLSFVALQDGHRLTPEQVQGLNEPWVGRGWLAVDDGFMGTRDWIFIAVPGPGTALVAGVAMMGLSRRRRGRGGA